MKKLLKAFEKTVAVVQLENMYPVGGGTNE